MKKIQIIKIFLLIFLLLSYIKPAEAQTNCNWKTVVTGGYVNTGGCTTTDKNSPDTSCPQPKPNNGLNSYSTCCCPVAQAATAAASKEPRFNIPIPEVTIPTVNLTEVKCVQDSSGAYSCAVPWIGEYINGIYQYGINIAGILAALVLMGGGLLWLISGGDASKITQAKDMIIGSITGLIILMSSYIILTQINPDLIKMKSISLGYINKDITPIPENAAAFLMNCKSTTTGPCAISSMSGFGARMYEASAICMAESGGNPSAHNELTYCGEGPMRNGYAVWGLFQFNLSANVFVDQNGKTLNCPKAFDKEWKNSTPSCKVVNQTLYDACVAAAITPELSILNAQNLVAASSGWGPWEANSKKCKF